MSNDTEQTCTDCGKPDGLCTCEPTLEQKAQVICGDNRDEYPVHWNDEVAEAYLDGQQQLATLRKRLLDVQLLHIALPLLAQMVNNTRDRDYFDRVQLQADAQSSAGQYVDPATVLVNGAVDLARGLMRASGVL